MRIHSLLAAIASAALPAVAMAQPISGFYIGAGAGGNFMPPEIIKQVEVVHTQPSNTTGSNFFTQPRTVTNTYKGKFTERFDLGGAGVFSAGYGLGNGLRIEAEGDYRYNNSRVFGLTREQKYGGMLNVLFDLDLGLSYIFPYLGAGVGYMWVNQVFDDRPTGTFAYQGIGGVAIPIPHVEGLSATLEYRFMGLSGTKRDSSNTVSPYYAYSDTIKFKNDLNHSVLLGVRYAFNTPPLVVPSVQPTPAQAVLPSRTYLVFFDWDRADLTDRARQIIAEAASASSHVNATRIEVQGNADRSGTPAYNQGLSLRRAQAVMAELVSHGVPKAAIAVQAFGDTRPLVPTAAGVREPQNRRVEIILK